MEYDTYRFAQTFVSLCLNLTALALLLLGLDFSISIISFGIAVDMQDICRTQSPLKDLVLRAEAAGRLTLVWASHPLRRHLTLGGLASVTHRRETVLVSF